MVQDKEIKILGLLCNWCSYAGADTAGSARLSYPANIRIVRLPCTGRIDPLFIARALVTGIDGVLVSGCHPGDCHYHQGNLYARRRLELLKRFLPFMGIDERRFKYTWVSASEAKRWQKVVNEFTEELKKSLE
ncbi:MAG: hydrogenase iron-sulfur subunit [Thermodesulfobacteriota bacterium]